MMRTAAGGEVAPCPFCDGFSFRHVHGPMPQRVLIAGDWDVRADQSPQDGKWDVYCYHRASGTRVPGGHNVHDDPAPEMVRLEKAIDWPYFQPRRMG